MTEMLHNLAISNFHPFKYKVINSINMHVNINQNAGENHFYTDKVAYICTSSSKQYIWDGLLQLSNNIMLTSLMITRVGGVFSIKKSLNDIP